MKKTMLLVAGMILFAGVHAQDDHTSGYADYTEVMKLELKIEGDISNFSNALPNEIKSEKELLFTPAASLYRKKEVEADMKEMMGGEGQTIKIQVAEPNEILYTDIKKKQTVEQKEFMTRMFLIEGGQEEHPWKMTGNQEMILGFPCQEAVTIRDSASISAWFTPAIPVSAGPASFSGLPGLVLKVDIDNGNRVIAASSVEFKEVPGDELTRPKKGKKVTRQEFDEIVAEKMKEQGQEVEGGKMMFIEIRSEQ